MSHASRHFLAPTSAVRSLTAPACAVALALTCVAATTADASGLPHVNYQATGSAAFAARTSAVTANSAPTVTANGGSYALAGTNVLRLADQLVQYTRTATQTQTPTNRWGIEVVVVGGKVTAISDRLITGAGGVAIPSNGYVLSGHNLARDWLLKFAPIGATVTLPGSTGVTSPVVPPVVVPPVVVPPVVVPVTGPVSTATTVATTTSTYALAGTNVERLADQLVKYTRTATQTQTPTNRWGIEVVVVGGKVTAISDRLETGSGPVEIPSTGYVLSGHNLARDWLVANAPIGTQISAGGTSTPPVTTPTPTTPTPTPTTPTPTPTPTPSTGTTGTAAARLLGKAPSGGAWFSGIWTGAPFSGARNTRFGAWRGAATDGSTTYPNYDSWALIQDSEWNVSVFDGVPGRLLYGMPIVPTDRSASMKQVAAGQFDSYFRKMANDMVKHGRGDSIVRIGWEANGDWYPWGSGVAESTDFKNAFRHVAQVLKAASPKILIDFNLACGRGLAGSSDRLAPLTTLYPGDDIVDIIGCDHYDAWETVSKTEAQWQASIKPARGTGLADIATFARAHKKGLSVPEWGLQKTDAHGGGDNPFFMTKMRAFFEANKDVMAYEAYFNESGDFIRSAIYDDVQNPLSSEKYKSLW